jgi:hypothetical protein
VRHTFHPSHPPRSDRPVDGRIIWSSPWCKFSSSCSYSPPYFQIRRWRNVSAKLALCSRKIICSLVFESIVVSFSFYCTRHSLLWNMHRDYFSVSRRSNYKTILTTGRYKITYMHVPCFTI